MIPNESIHKHNLKKKKGKQSIQNIEVHLESSALSGQRGIEGM